MDTLLHGAAVVEFYGGAADGEIAEYPYPMQAYLVRAGDTYRLYCSRPFADVRYAHYKLVRKLP